MNSCSAWKEVLEKFEAFLATIPLGDYRKELEPVKTVEQDLPKELNPLPAIYASYWVTEPVDFPDYETFFRTWWTEHLRPLDAFIRKYFWGCSYEFVYLGFKARIYRTLISVLTQFHFAYSWLTHCELPLEASAELDMAGVDALVQCGDKKIALQVKKETYRAEARERGRFARRKVFVDFTVEVPYTIVPPDEWQKRIQKARKDERIEQYKIFAWLAEHFQRWLPNDFVVFQPDYPLFVERMIKDRVKSAHWENIGWQETLKLLKALPSKGR